MLIAGTTGTGKTTLSCLFARDACSRGERVLYISFEESQEAVISTMLSPGIDLRPAFQEGLLQMISSMPESMNVEGHLFVAFEKLDSLQPDHIVVDAISACERMGSRQHAYSYLTTLLNECKRRSITCIFVNQVSKMADLHEITGIGVSSLVDSILFLQFGEEGGELNRTLTVIKSRGGKHSNQFREYCITDQGLEIKEVYLGEGGVLTGVTRQEQEAREETQRQRRLQIIHIQRQELNQKRAALEAKTADYLSEIEMARAKLDILEEEEHVWKKSRIERGKMRGAKLTDTGITGTAK
ncbi:hypothetical protein JWG39_15195 [Desulforhopalus vacuolatus]|nr:hypothetical protein [Desulforhopalus vacuolatus]